MGPIRRAWIGLAVAALASAAVPAVAAADEPEITRRPALSGSALVGAQLYAVGASWRGWPSPAVSWGWVRCGSDSPWSCENIEGAVSMSYTPTPADLGKRLRAWVYVSNRDGRDWDWSEASAAVTAPPPPAPPPPAPTVIPQPAPPPVEPAAAPPAPKLMRHEPVVRIRGWLTERGARITLLSVRAPRGARIAVSCSGIGCPRVAPAQAAKRTRLRAYEGMFRAGARIVIRVTRPGYVGKHTLIRIRHGKAPLRFDRCLYPGSKAPASCSAA